MGVMHGKGGIVKVGANAVLQVDGWGLTTSVNTADTTVMGSAWESHLPGQTSWEGSCSCLMDNSDTTGQEALVEGASVSITFYPGGSTAGLKNYSGTATVTKVTHAGTKNGIVTRNIELKGNGALTRTANP